MAEMGGSISAHSDGLGTGAMFTLLMPLVAETPEAASDEPSAALIPALSLTPV
jgi:hypothetical protein